MIQKNQCLFTNTQCKVCCALLISESQKLAHYQVCRCTFKTALHSRPSSKPPLLPGVYSEVQLLLSHLGVASMHVDYNLKTDLIFPSLISPIQIRIIILTPSVVAYIVESTCFGFK